MKTINIYLSIMAIFLFFGIRNLQAENNPVFPDNLNKHLSANIKYPETAKIGNLQGFVLVSFTVGEDGFIKIDGINASNNLLKNYVEDKLLDIQLCPYDKSVGQTFNMKFDFQLMKE